MRFRGLTIPARPRRSRLVPAVVVAVVSVVVAYGIVQSGAIRAQAPVALGPPAFVDETASAGISQVYDGGFDYAAGGGVAAFDCSGDGKPDLYIAGGKNGAALYRNDSPVGGALRFARVTDPVTDLAGVTGAYPIDIDGDGIVDLAVLRAGAEEVLLRGLGGCRFERANERWGFRSSPSITMAFSATWESAAPLPTLAFGRYVDPASNDPHHLCSENLRAENLRGLKIRRDENPCLETFARRLRCDRVGQIASRRAGNCIEAKVASIGERHRDHSILEAQGRKANRVILKVEIARANLLTELWHT